MKRSVSVLQRGSLVSWMLFAWAIAAEMNFLPRLTEAFWLRWQVTLLAGIVFRTAADHLADFRCRCCGAPDVMLRSLTGPSHELLCQGCLSWEHSLEGSASSAHSN